MLQLHNLSYIHPDKSLLFDQLNLNLRHHDKIALIGNNGSGKSTLLKIIAGKLQPTHGLVKTAVQPYYMPQVFGQLNHLSVARAMGIDQKLSALKTILNGDVSDDVLHALDDDWTIEERAIAALSVWQLEGLNLSQSMNDLSGGQKTKVFLAGMSLHKPEFMLLDEPTNHLDLRARKQLYDFILQVNATMIVVSHDRSLLNFLPAVCELTQHGIREYGGNYEFYEQQKKIELNALSQDIQEKEKAMRKAKEKERETKERQQKSDARGKAKQEKAGLARIMMNTLRNKAENSTRKLKAVHAEKIAGIDADLKYLRSGIPGVDKIRFGFNDSELHKGKVLFSATNIQFAYDEKL